MQTNFNASFETYCYEKEKIIIKVKEMKFFAGSFKPVLTVSSLAYLCSLESSFLANQRLFLKEKNILRLLLKNHPFDKYRLIYKHNLRKPNQIHKSDSQIKKQIEVETHNSLANEKNQFNDKQILEKIEDFRSDSNIISGLLSFKIGF